MKDAFPALLWIIDNNLGELLDRATWLETSSELCNFGWQVTLMSPGFPQYEVDNRIKAVRIPRPKLYLVGRLIFLLFLVFRIVISYRDVDIILFHQQSAPFLLPLVLLRNLLNLNKPKFIMDSRTAPMDTISIRGRLWVTFFACAHFMANRLADGQTSITRRLAQAQGIPDFQLLGVWSSGVKPERFIKENSLRCWPTEADPLRLIYIGAINEERNLLALIDAVRNVRSEGYNVTLDLVGDGPQRIELEEYVRGIGDGTIQVCHAVPPAEIPKVLASAHVGVLPFSDLPKFQISSPIKLFEYMAAGMPVLATRIACHTDVLGDSKFVFWAVDGSVMALVDAILAANSQKMELMNLGSNAALAVQGWSWREASRKLDQSLRRILTESVL